MSEHEMYAAVITREAGEAEFRTVARRAFAANLSPEQLAFVAPDDRLCFRIYRRRQAKYRASQYPELFRSSCTTRFAIAPATDLRFFIKCSGVLCRVSVGWRRVPPIPPSPV